MEFKKIKENIELLLIKKNNFSIDLEEQLLLDELMFLLHLANKLTPTENNNKCNCEVNYKTIEQEIMIDKCFDCGLPISDL